jgi:L-asparagine transporter-like permease
MLAMTPVGPYGQPERHRQFFVRAFEAAGIPFGASIINLVVISAALSSANTNLYLSTPHAVFIVPRSVRTALVGTS